jgi:hypothetical protein
MRTAIATNRQNETIALMWLLQRQFIGANSIQNPPRSEVNAAIRFLSREKRDRANGEKARCEVLQRGSKKNETSKWLGEIFLGVNLRG